MYLRRSVAANHLFSRNVSQRSTVNVEELEKFSGMANEWWDADGPVKPLHSLNKIR